MKYTITIPQSNAEHDACSIAKTLGGLEDFKLVFRPYVSVVAMEFTSELPSITVYLAVKEVNPYAKVLAI
jgi:hypothetical protein